ncbi:MAG: LysR family transcriptional regulator [Desulfovibrio sp.]|nr:LysR family transcriptional regulator [Desulfovibrio sp.]
MELRSLRYFLAVAREGSITRAAHALHLTQPTLSRQMQELEEELGAKLLVRRSHSVELTPEGMRLRQRAGEVQALVEQTRAEFRQQGSAVEGDVYIGGGETRVMRLLAGIVREVRDEHPGIRIHLYSGNAEDVTWRLDKGLLDFGVLIQPASLDKYEHLPLPDRDVWVAVVPCGHALAELPCATRQDLLPWPLILSRQAIADTGPDNEFVGWFGEDWGSISVAATFNLVYNAALLVRAGAGVMVTIDGLVGGSGQSGLASVPLEPRLETALDIVWRRGRIFSPAAALVLAAFQERFGKTQ